MELSEQLRKNAISNAKQRLSVRYAQEYRETLVEECEKLGIKPPKKQGKKFQQWQYLQRRIAQLEHLLENQSEVK